jgi:hypothetical protein
VALALTSRRVTRILLLLALAFAALAPRVALADPTPDQMEAAKKAFVEGKALHDQGKLADAVEKFKESYRLSKNPLLLYNIGFTYDELKNANLALVYYRQFLSEAPASATQRPEVADRVKALEKEAADADLAGGSGSASGAGSAATPSPPVTTQPKPTAIKPPGTYKAEDFQHQIVTEAPPGKPLDLSATVPADSGFAVTLFYRRAGQSDFTPRPMHPHGSDLVARIPAAAMAGTSIQYYLEVKDAAGTVVTRSGKSTSPNVVDIDAAAPPRFFPDIVDTTPPPPPTGTDENPLGGAKGAAAQGPVDAGTPGATGFFDVGSKKFEITKWSATGATVALLGLSLYFYAEAGQQASALRKDAGLNTSNGQPCAEPCHTFDGFDLNLEAVGQRDQTASRVLFGFGVVGVGVAGYFWYRQLFGKHASSSETAAPPAHDETSWIVVPAIGDGFTGAAAAARF